VGKLELIQRLRRALSIQALKKVSGQYFRALIKEGVSVEMPINLLVPYYDILNSGDEVFPNLLKVVGHLPLRILMPDNTEATISLSLEIFTKMCRRTKVPCWCCGRLLYKYLWAHKSDNLICLGGRRVREPCKYLRQTICREDGNCKGKGLGR